MRVGAALLLLILSSTRCSSGSSVQIDYVDFVQLGGTQYIAARTSPGRPLQEGDLGAQYGTVKSRLADSSDPGHQLRDGDSAFLAVGTTLYSLKSYKPSFRLAERSGPRLVSYQAVVALLVGEGEGLYECVGRGDYWGLTSPNYG